MMNTTSERYELPSSFTFSIVEIVKNIRIHPISPTKPLPWGLSLATGFILAILGFGLNLSVSNHLTAFDNSISQSEMSLSYIDNLPMMMASSQPSYNIAGGGTGNNQGLGTSGQQNISLAPKGEGGKIPDKPSAQLGKGWLGGLAYSPDGKILAMATGLGIKLLDAENFNEIGILQENQYSGDAIAFSPDGKILAGYTSEGISLWDIQTKKRLGLIPGPSQVMTFSPDSNILAKSVFDENSYKSIALWDIEKMEQIGLLRGHTLYVSSILFTPDGKRLISASNDKTIRLWDVQEKKQIGQFEGHKNAIWSIAIAISSDGKILASGSGNKDNNEAELFLWDIQTQNLIASLKGHNVEVTSVAFSPDGKILASGGGDIDQTIRIWDVQTQKQIALFQGNAERISQIIFNPNGRTIASNINGSAIKFWDIQEQKQIGAMDGFGSEWTVAFSPDGKTVVSSGNNRVLFWNITEQKPIGEGVQLGTDLDHLAYSPDGKILAGSSYTQTAIFLIDVQEQKQMGVLKGHTRDIRSIAFSPDSKLIASGSEDMTFRLWDVQEQKEVWIQNCPSYIHSVAFTPDGKYILSAIGREGTIRIWNVKTKSQTSIIQAPAMSVAISPDGKTLVSGGQGLITIWDLNKERQIGSVELDKKDFFVWYIIFSPDGKWVIPLMDDGTCRILDVEDQKQIASLEMKPIYRVAFSPDGRWLATCGGNGAISFWEVNIPVSGKAVNPMGKAFGTWGDIKKSQLYQNFPNPFNPETWIPFSLSNPEHVIIKIYDSAGKLVRKLDLGNKESGEYISKEKSAYWDGKNEQGEQVASNTYFTVMEAGKFKDVKKMVIVR